MCSENTTCCRKYQSNAVLFVFLGYENLALPGTCCSGKRLEDDVLSVTSITSKVVVTSDDDRAQTRSIIFMVAMSLDCVFEGKQHVVVVVVVVVVVGTLAAAVPVVF